MSQPNLIAAAEEAGGFARFLAFVEAAGLGETLNGPGRYTIFAPTDEAFDKLSPGMRDKLNPKDKLALKALVSVHLVSGQMLSQRLLGRRIRGKSVQGCELLIDGGASIRVNGALIVRPDILAANGVVHGIDHVLWPLGAQLEVA